MPRYVPKTYNNRRLLRIILGTIITFALSTVILFLILFFLFSRYVVDGQLIIPWLPEFQGPAHEDRIDDPPHDNEASNDYEIPNDDELPNSEETPNDDSPHDDSSHNEPPHGEPESADTDDD